MAQGNLIRANPTLSEDQTLSATAPFGADLLSVRIRVKINLYIGRLVSGLQEVQKHSNKNGGLVPCNINDDILRNKDACSNRRSHGYLSGDKSACRGAGDRRR